MRPPEQSQTPASQLKTNLQTIYIKQTPTCANESYPDSDIGRGGEAWWAEDAAPLLFCLRKMSRFGRPVFWSKGGRHTWVWGRGACTVLTAKPTEIASVQGWGCCCTDCINGGRGSKWDFKILNMMKFSSHYFQNTAPFGFKAACAAVNVILAVRGVCSTLYGVQPKDALLRKKNRSDPGPLSTVLQYLSSSSICCTFPAAFSHPTRICANHVRLENNSYMQSVSSPNLYTLPQQLGDREVWHPCGKRGVADGIITPFSSRLQVHYGTYALDRLACMCLCACYETCNSKCTKWWLFHNLVTQWPLTLLDVSRMVVCICVCVCVSAYFF